MAIKTLRVFQEFTSEGYVPMPVDGNIDYGYTIAGTFPSTTPSTFQTDDPDLDVTLTETTDYYVWIRSNGTAWNPMYTRNVRVYPDSPSINNVVMGIIIANLNSTVPYEGATENVDLGEFGIKAGYVEFDTTPTGTPTTEGTMSWDSGNGTANLTLKGGNVNLAIGQEMVARVYNDTGVALTDGQIVYITGAQGNRVKVGLASNATEMSSSVTFGMVTEPIAIGAEGFVTVQGTVNKLNTVGLTEGASLWLGNTPGTYTATKPTAPLHAVLIGYVERVHATVGSIYVKVQNGYELNELHNVLITTPLTNDVLIYDATATLWKNKPLVKTNGYIPYFDTTDIFKDSPIFTNGTQVSIGGTSFTSTNKLTIHGDMDATNITASSFIKSGGTSSQFLKADGSIDANSYYLSSNPSSFIDLTDLSATTPLSYNNTTGAFSISQANTTTNGFLSSTDWNTFNNKQTALNGTGFVKISGTTITYDNTSYQPLLSLSAGYIPKATSLSALGNSLIYDNGSGIGINTTSVGSNKLFVEGTSNFNGDISVGTWKTISNTVGSIIAFGGISASQYQRVDIYTNGIQRIAIDATSTSIIATSPILDLVYDLGTSYKHSIVGSVYSGTTSDNAMSFKVASGGGTQNTPLVLYGNNAAVFSGNVTANSYIKSGGTSSQYLMADGSTSTLANIITGSLTSGYVPKSTGTNTISNSLIYDNGSGIGIGLTSLSAYFSVNGDAKFNGGIGVNRSADLVTNWGVISNGGTNGSFYRAYSGSIESFRIQVTSTASTISSYLGNLVFDSKDIANVLVLASTTGNASFISSVTATQFIRSGGTSTQYLMADGSVSTLTNPITGTGTSGYVGYWSGTNTMTSSSSLFWNNTTRVLGIGTVSPLLETNRNGIVVRGGTGGAEFVLQSTSSTDGTYDGFSMAMEANQAYLYNKRNGSIRFGANNTLKAELKVNGDFDITGAYLVNGTAILSGSGLSGYLSKWTSSSVIANSIVYDNGTNLTIGGTSALYKLTVTPLSNINFGVGVTSFTGTNNAIFLNATDATFGSIPMSINASILGFSTGYTEAGRIDGSQNWFIGGTGVTGGGKVQVTGDVNISGAFKVNGVALSSGVGGSGTANYIPKFATGTTLGNSGLFDGSSYIDVTSGALRLNNYLALSYSGGIINVGFDSGLSGVALTVGGTEKLRVNTQGIKVSLPTSSSGLSSGQLWNDAGTIKIV